MDLHQIKALHNRAAQPITKRLQLAHELSVKRQNAGEGCLAYSISADELNRIIEALEETGA